jgi:uncharacterized membrane protein YfcA
VVTTLGLTTAASYALSRQVDWWLVALLVAGGVLGSIGGIALGKRLADRRRLMEVGFAALVIVVGIYVVLRGI